MPDLPPSLSHSNDVGRGLVRRDSSRASVCAGGCVAVRACSTATLECGLPPLPTHHGGTAFHPRWPQDRRAVRPPPPRAVETATRGDSAAEEWRQRPRRRGGSDSDGLRVPALVRRGRRTLRPWAPRRGCFWLPALRDVTFVQEHCLNCLFFAVLVKVGDKPTFSLGARL